MYPIGIVGDLHVDVHISSRKDNYFQTCLMKIEEVASQCKNVIFLGDVFNRETLPNDFLYSFYTHLSYLKLQYGTKFYSIIGNHDIPNEDEDNLSKTSLGLCEVTGLIILIKPDKPINIEGINFYTSYVRLDRCKKHLKTLKLKKDDILLLHQYFEDGFPGVDVEDLQVGCNKVFLGHNHIPLVGFKKEYDDLTVYRSGSLLRNSAEEANLTRDIYYYAIDDKVNLIKLNCVRPAVDVFTEKAYKQENLHQKRFTKSITEVLDKYTNNASVQTKFSIKETLEEINTPEKCMLYIENIYTRIGETFI